MKKGNKKFVAKSLATATCALLGTSGTNPVHAQEEPLWRFDTALLYYGENDDRVQDLSLNVLARRSFTDDRILSLGLTVDSLTGATPVGAAPMDVAQTFTRPSGNSAFTVPANTQPLDDTFWDTRYAVTAGWQQPLGRLFTGTAGVSFSDEYDYTHFGANFGLTRDFNKRNTTVNLGVAFAQDDIEPISGSPTPLSPMLDVGDISNRRGTESKDVVDVLLGVTQVINQNLLVQLNYSFSDSSGYLNDPYRVLSLVDPISGDTLARTPAPGIEGPSHEFRFESRPDSRAKHSLFAQAKYYMAGKVLDVSYRYMTDDWDIDSHTIDAKLKSPLQMIATLNLTYATTPRQKRISTGRPLPPASCCLCMRHLTTDWAISMRSRPVSSTGGEQILATTSVCALNTICRMVTCLETSLSGINCSGTCIPGSMPSFSISVIDLGSVTRISLNEAACIGLNLLRGRTEMIDG